MDGHLEVTLQSLSQLSVIKKSKQTCHVEQCFSTVLRLATLSRNHHHGTLEHEYETPLHSLIILLSSNLVVCSQLQGLAPVLYRLFLLLNMNIESKTCTDKFTLPTQLFFLNHTPMQVTHNDLHGRICFQAFLHTLSSSNRGLSMHLMCRCMLKLQVLKLIPQSDIDKK